MTCEQAAASICPICGGQITHAGIRVYRNIIIFNGCSVSLGPCQLTIVNALLRNPSLSTMQLEERVGVNNNNMRQIIFGLRKKLVGLAKIVNISSSEGDEAVYVLREIG